MSRKIKLIDGEIQSFFIKKTLNPCGCGSNVYHQEFDGEKLFGVCNACKRDIYEFEYDEDYIKNSEWQESIKF